MFVNSSADMTSLHGLMVRIACRKKRWELLNEHKFQMHMLEQQVDYIF